MYALLLAVMLTAAAPELEVRTSDGRTMVGLIVELDSEKVTLRTADGPVSVGIDKLMTISAKQKPDSSVSDPGAWIELTDGSSLVVQEFTVADGRARITIAENQVIEAPVAVIATVRLAAQSEDVATEWTRLVNMDFDGDILVVRKDQTIDYHKGLLGDVTEKVVQFDLDGQLLPIKRPKVHGLIYHRPAGGQLPEAICRITDASGSRWPVRSMAMPDNLKWTTPAGVTVTQPLASVVQIDFSHGKIVQLGDLQPESVTWTPYFGSDKKIPVIEKFYAPRKDKSLESGPLKLAGKTYAKGLSLHSRTKVVYRLPGRFSRFRATAGIDDGVRPHGHLRLIIRGDDRVLLQEGFSGADPPKPIDLDLTGVRRLIIEVDFGEKLDVADHLDLCEARILK